MLVERAINTKCAYRKYIRNVQRQNEVFHYELFRFMSVHRVYSVYIQILSPAMQRQGNCTNGVQQLNTIVIK